MKRDKNFHKFLILFKILSYVLAFNNKFNKFYKSCIVYSTTIVYLMK